MDRKGGIVITGASTGIGRASTLALVRLGFQVFAGVRSEAAGEELRRHAAAGLVPIQLDVTDERLIREASETVSRALGDDPLVGLMNNAGITVNGPLEFVPVEEVRRQLEVNLIGPLRVTQAFLPRLRRDRGRIVFTGSISGFFTTPIMGPYCMSKYAMEAMADALRLELRPLGVHVALLQPGSVATPIWGKGRGETAAFLEAAPPALEQLYGPLVQGVAGMVEMAETSAASPEVVVKAVVHAFTSRRPRARYCMGGNARVQQVVARLPSRWRDWILARLLRRA